MLQIITQLARNLFVFTILVLVLILLQRPVVGQVTSVSQLSDVKPTNWAFQALQSLVERYGCEGSYVDKTYRGDRAVTRYEVAALLNICLDRVQEMVAVSGEDLVTVEEFLKLEKLQEGLINLVNERTQLQNRINALQSRILTLEN